jgi:hypothetical protein
MSKNIVIAAQLSTVHSKPETLQPDNVVKYIDKIRFPSMVNGLQDVYSPSLAPLVGQDFVFMGDYAKWVKPMIYRFGNGPSSLRSEIPALINELGAYLVLEENEVLDWVGSQIEELRNLSLKQLEKSVPLNFMQTEIRKAVNLFSETPVYLGLETVSIPGVMEIKPQHVKEILDIEIDAGVNGYVLSWDLLHTRIENVLPIKGLI